MSIQLLTRVIIVFLIGALNLSAIQAQQPTVPSANAVQVKATVDKISTQDKITVALVPGGEEYGNFISREQESFTFYDVDQKANVTLRYDEVKHVKKGYGGKNHLTSRHTNRSYAIVFGVVLAGVLVGLIVAAANMKS